MNIVIGFSRPKSPFKVGSLLIRRYLGTEYSHVFLKFYSSKYDRHLIYEAVGSGVRFVGKHEWEMHAVVTSEHTVHIQEASSFSIMQFCIDHSGQSYGAMQNIGLVLAKLFKWSKNPFKKGVNCSELIAMALIEAGYDVNTKLDLITPRDIEDLLKTGLGKSVK
jgi:hypothetical protein